MSAIIDPAVEFDPRAARLRTIAEGLAAPREAIESGFTAVGSRLSDAAAIINRLSRIFDALPQALEGSEVAEATDKLRAVADAARTIGQSYADEKVQLQRLVTEVEAARAPIEELQRTIKMMGIVSINARVTAAGIVGENEDFAVFTTDIAQLSASASQTIQEFSQSYQRVVGDVQNANTQREQFDREHANTLAELADSLEGALMAVAEQRQRTLAGSADTGKVSRQIAARIGGAVMALQVGDSTRQRLEHVEAALVELAERQVGAPEDPTIAVISALQQAQLSDAGETFAAEVNAAAEALTALAGEASAMMQHSRSLYGSDNGSSALSSLNRQLRAAVQVLRSFERERQKLESMAKAVESTVRTLLTHVEAVQEIEANMRLVSLNAAIRCAQLGPRGAPLTVIAVQLRELTTGTVVSAESAMERLSTATRLVEAFAAGADGSGHLERIEGEASHAVELLSRLDGLLSEALAALDSEGPKVLAALEIAADELGAQTRLVEAMADASLALAEYGHLPDADTLPPDVLVHAARLAAHYTMSAERDVHARLFGTAGAAPEAPANDADLLDFEL
jgi:hypothetical protein